MSRELEYQGWRLQCTVYAVAVIAPSRDLLQEFMLILGTFRHLFATITYSRINSEEHLHNCELYSFR